MRSPHTFPEAFEATLHGTCACVVALIVAFAVRHTLDVPILHLGTAAVFAVLAPVLVLVLVARKKLPGRAGAIAGLATLGWLPLVYLRLEAEHLEMFKGRIFYGTLAVRALFHALLLFVPLVLASSVLAAFARHPRFDRVLRITSVVAVVVVSAAMGVGLLRARRATLHDYFLRLPPDRLLHLGETLDLGSGAPVTYAWHPDPIGGGKCSLDNVNGGAGFRAATADGCVPLEVAHADADDAWTLAVRTRRGEMLTDVDFWVVLTAVDRWPHGLDVRELVAPIGPPHAWMLASVLGSFGGVALLAAGYRQSKRSVSGTDATLRDDGWVAYGTGPPIPLRPGGTLEAGPVVVRLRPREPDAYREPGSNDIESWQRGTLEQARTEIEGYTTSLYVLGMTSALLASAPLLLSRLGWTHG